MIKFKKIILEGFGSYVYPTKIKLDRPGLNIVIAKTGAGKTSIFSGIRYALYGVNLKGEKQVGTWTFQRPEDYKGTKVHLYFRKGKDKYEVIRCEEYQDKVEGSKGKDRLIFLINGVQSTKRNKGDIQTQINDIMGYTDELFVNAIIFGQGMKRLIDETGPNKKKIFEQAFESQFINEGKKRAESDLKAVQEQLAKVENEYFKANVMLQSTQSQIETMREARKQFEKQNRLELATRAVKIVDLQKRLNAEPIKDISKVKRKLDTQREELARLDYASAEKIEREYNLLNRQVKEAEELAEYQKNLIEEIPKKIKAVPKTCTECGSFLDGQGVRKVIKGLEKQRERLLILYAGTLENIDELKVAFKKKNKELASIIHRKRNRMEVQDIIDKLEEQIEEHQNLKNQRNRWEDQIADYQKDIEHLKLQKPSFKVKPLIKTKKELKSRVKSVRSEVKRLSKEVLDLKWVVGDVLSNKGLKSYIFETSLTNLNHRLRYYEQFIGYRVEFKVDFDSANKDIYTICYIKDNIVYYESLSGGQKQQVNLCTAFALNDMVTEGKPLNILVLDEVFENLDEGLVDMVYDLIRERTRDKSLYLITHNLNLQNSGDKVIRMSLNKEGQTVMKLLAP
jgi:DNA repair exonuclease SbcCD ATPase subunit